MIEEVDKLSKKYAIGSACIFCVLFLFGLLAIEIWNISEIMTPLIVSAIFAVAVDMADVIIWRNVAKKAQSYLTTFYTAVSAFRMLLALATMFVYYLIEGQGAMLVFFLVFMVFYMASLAHHTFFFAKLSNKS
ncbi:MAG: hypothetical protein J6B91_01045 [Prevotella sp.]|nr:hypothetical protein [Prevotella sp.]